MGVGVGGGGGWGCIDIVLMVYYNILRSNTCVQYNI